MAGTQQSGIGKRIELINQHRLVPGPGWPGGPDGLELRPPPDHLSPIDGVPMAERLRGFLLGLRLLRGVPLCYLVPDPKLLPLDSIRFFHVDLTWTERLVQGALSAATIDTVDAVVSYDLLKGIRDELDHGLEHDGPISGMLMRSELVRRWPALHVEAFVDPGGTVPMRLLRRDLLSRDLLIVLFAGIPGCVQLREPKVGTRYGVEQDKQTDQLKVDVRDVDGVNLLRVVSDDETEPLPCPVSINGERCLNFEKLEVDVKAMLAAPPIPEPAPALANEKPSSRLLALNLEQRPYVQAFTTAQEESEGWDYADPDEPPVIMLRRGRPLDLTRVIQRHLHKLGGE